MIFDFFTFSGFRIPFFSRLSYFVGVLAVYDVSDRESFENVKIWLNDAEKFAKGADAKWLIGKFFFIPIFA